MPNLVVVGLAEVKWSTSAEDVLVAFSLGSCVGLALWDPERRVGGLAHVMLPSSVSRRQTNGVEADKNADAVDEPGKYGDTAVAHLVRCLAGLGANPKNLKVWLAGGAHVLRGVDLPGGDIGAQNTRAVQEALKQLGLSEPRQDVGEDYGRTMKLYIGEGRVTVYSYSRGEKEI